MIWLAILFFCSSEQDCKFAYYEAISPMECENKLANMQAVAIAHQLPFHAGTCVVIKGNRIKNG